MPDDRPVSRCAVKGCAYVGYWPRDGRCPMHDNAECDPPVMGSRHLRDALEDDLYD